MWMFYFLLLTPVLVQHISVKGISYEKKNRFALTLFFVMLTVLVMLRHESVGNDTSNYAYFFRKFASLDLRALFSETLEFGFAFYNKFVSVFTKDPQVFFTVTAIITSAMIYPTYRRMCSDTSLTITLFAILSTFVMMFSGIRQMLAIGLGVIAYELVRKKKMISFIAIVVLAMTIHTSAFMLFLLYPIYNAKITKKMLYIVVPVITLIMVFNRQIFNFLAGILMAYTRFDSVDMTYTSAYSILVLFIIFAVFSYVIPDEAKLDEETKGLRNILILAIVIQCFAPVHSLAMRMNYYFIIFIPLLMPKIISVSKDSVKQLALLGRHIMVIFFLIYFFAVQAPSGVLRVFPYHFFWESVV